MQEKEVKQNKYCLFVWTNICTKHDSIKIIKWIGSKEDVYSCHIRVEFNSIEYHNSFITNESHLFICIRDGNVVNLGNVAR